MPADHILTYARGFLGGGVERAMLRLAGAWIAAGRRVTLVIGDPRGPLLDELPAGVELIPSSPPGRSLSLALPAIVRAAAPDILFCAGNTYTGLAAWTKLRLGRACPPIVGKMSNAPRRADHGAVLDAGHRAWLALHGRFLDHLVAMTPATAAAAERALHMAGRVTVIPNPPAARRPGAGPPALPTGRFVLGVGRLAPQKRWDRLIAALSALPPDIALVILGEGACRSALERQATALGIADRVHLPGHVADPFPAMAAAGTVALTSDYEGVPGVLREALSVGTPVVTTPSSDAIAEIVVSPAHGSIVGFGDHAGLVAALRHHLDAPRPRPVAQLGADAAERYLALFDRLVAQRLGLALGAAL